MIGHRLVHYKGLVLLYHEYITFSVPYHIYNTLTTNDLPFYATPNPHTHTDASSDINSYSFSPAKRTSKDSLAYDERESSEERENSVSSTRGVLSSGM